MEYVALGGVVLWALFGMWLTYRGLTAPDEGGIYNQEDDR